LEEKEELVKRKEQADHVSGIKSYRYAQHFAEIDFDRFKTVAEDLVDDYQHVKGRLADEFEYVKDFVHRK
jgi:hypothetical protein